MYTRNAPTFGTPEVEEELPPFPWEALGELGAELLNEALDRVAAEQHRQGYVSVTPIA